MGNSKISPCQSKEESQNSEASLELTELRLLFEILKLFTLDWPADFSSPTASGEQQARLESLLELLQRHTRLQRGFCAALLAQPPADSSFQAPVKKAEAAKNPVLGGESDNYGHFGHFNMACLGLNASERESTARSLREGVIGLALAGGQAVLLAKGRAEPLFLNRSETLEVKKAEIFLICVPIWLNGRCLGALGADRLFSASTPLEEDVRLLRHLAGLLAQAAKAGLEAATARQTLLAENRRLQKRLSGQADWTFSEGLAAGSQSMRRAMEEAALAARGQAPLLLLGESGSGKENLASLIHAESTRAGRPFVVFNCSALPPGALEGELFGSERGAFGGSAVRPGYLESARGGTLFLDDVSELPAAAQVRLLRAVEHGEFSRLGGSAPLPLDFRLIAASERSLEELAALTEQGLWRADFYRCLALNSIYLPPLRKRKDDILPLVNRLLEKSPRRGGRKITRLSPAAVGLLMSYPWPGNLRELENVIERAVMVSGESEVIESRHLPPWLQRGVEGAAHENAVGYFGKQPGALPTELPGELVIRKAASLDESLNTAELALIEESLTRHRGNMARAAQALGISQRIMGLRLKKHGLDYRRFRQK